MNFNLYYADFNSLSADELIRRLKDRNKNQRHIIITPDKASLYYERRLFTLLQEESFFDVMTTTLSRFANGVVGKADNILSKQGGVLIVKRILLENKTRLKSFAKASDLVGFAGGLFDTICMFKSCRITPDQIGEVVQENLNNKLYDIKLVYEKYEEYLSVNYTDSFNRLNLCASKISKENYKDCNFYFVGFDDFTKQGYLIIEKLIKCSNSVSIATTFVRKNPEKNNSNIYLNSVYYNCMDLCQLIGVECNRIEVGNSFDNEKKFVSQQLLSNKVKAFNGEKKYIELIKYNSIEDEIKKTALDIKYSIINNNLRYKNFSIVVSDINIYKNSLVQIFNKLGINYFIDESIKLKDTMFARFVSNLISVLYKPTKFNVIKFLKSKLLSLNSQDIDNYMEYVDKYEPQYTNLLRCENNAINQIFEILLNYKRSGKSTIEELLDSVESLLKELTIDVKLDNLLKKYYMDNNLNEYRLLKQSYEKVIKIFDEIKVIRDYECTYQEVNKFFELFAENSTIVVPPIVTDAVFITDINCSNLQDVDYVYFLGFNDGFAPRYSSDSGIISDDEINKMPTASRINPTINVINKRLKFNLFELVFMAKEKVKISYFERSGEGDSYPNIIVNSLIAIYGVDSVERGSNCLDLINNNFVSFNNENFVYNNFSKDVAKDNYVALLKQWDNYHDNKNYVKTLAVLNDIVADKTYLENNVFVNNIKPISDGLFLTKNKLGISQVERFNTCPYLHFVDYGLRLQSSEKNEMSAIDLGNIIHEFVKEAVFRLNEESISGDILNIILAKDDYKYIVENERNNFVLKSLREEVERIFRVLKYQQKQSLFKTTKTEMPFNMNVCTINGKDICLTGVVDRVDEYNNGVRIVDYKTGKVSFKNYDDVYYGNKIQVVVYLSALSKKHKLKPLGALYLPISNAFANEKSEDLYQMQGIVEKSLETLLAFDKSLTEKSYSSSIVNLSTTTKGEMMSNSFYKNMCLAHEEIEKLSEFVLNMVKNTILNIKAHIISPSPINDEVCQYCEYKGLCNFSEKYGNSYREPVKVKNIEELLGGNHE